MSNIRGITGIKRAVLIAVVVLLFIPLNLSAEVTFTSLALLENGLKLPEDVAVAPDGKAYAVDGSQGLIMVYNRNSSPAGNIWISKATSVAINADGLLYVGTNDNLSVKILDSSHNVIGSLGSGAAEFKLPGNIAIDKVTGNVYVVDQIDQSIKVYTSSGTFIKKISDYPNLPQDVTVMNNKIYVIDHPLITDKWGGKIRGAKVRVFDMDGNVLDAETFGSYGDQEGQFVRPAGITSDADGVLYISDSFHGVVMCFEADGTYLGAIQDTSDPMVTPVGIALGIDRRLFIASLNTAGVHVFGLEGYTEPEEIDVSPSSLTFSVEEGQTNPPEQNLTINNTGSGIKTYTAFANQNWIVLNPASVTIEDGSTGTIPVGVQATGLVVGTTYNGQVTITDETGALANIPVTLEVTIPVTHPALSVSPEKLDFTYKIGDTSPSPQTVTVELTNDDGTTEWTAETDVGWLGIVPSTGQGGQGDSTSIATVTVNPTGLETGDHMGTITIRAPDADGSPATVTVMLEVINGGAIQVTCNIEDASFSIESPDGVTYEGSGKTWSEGEVPDCTYTITYNKVLGYRTPSSETKELSNAGTISFEGNYTSLAKDADIVVTPGGTEKAPVVEVFNEDGILLFTFTPFSKTTDSRVKGRGPQPSIKGSVITAVGDIDGDGEQDIVAALQPPNSTTVKIASYKADGSMIPGSDFTVSAATVNRAHIDAADFDGDGKAEIIVGFGGSSYATSNRSSTSSIATDSRIKGPKLPSDPRYPEPDDPDVPTPPETNPAFVRIFSYDARAIVDTGISLNACTGSVNVAAGDVDGDNTTELVTAPGTGTSDDPEIRVWKIDTSGGKGNWSVSDTGILIPDFSGEYGANVTLGDLNGDGAQEIIASSGPDPQGGLNIIKAFNGDGTEFGLEIYDGSVGYGLHIAAADLDSDGVAEIIAGLGTSKYSSPTVKIYKADGTLYNTFIAFEGECYGAIVSAGDLGY